MEPLRPGDPASIGPFRLLARLGSGGMGRVYLGKGPGGLLASVKVVHDGLAGDPEFRRRFGREVRIAGAVRGPWVAAVLDADPNAPVPWLATEYIAGPSLREAVRSGAPLPAESVLALAARLATALAELHAMGVVHRDLKPSNVLLGSDGPKLIDFGIAKALDATKITNTGMSIGTPEFMSPEQAAGERETPASDVFSLAAVLVFACSGQGPFGRASGEVAMLRRVVASKPDLAAVPEPLRAVLEGCLAKAPEQRPSAAALAHRLRGMAELVAADAWRTPGVADLVRQIPPRVKPPSPTNPPERYEGKRDWAIVAFVLVLLMLIGGGGALLVATKLWARQPAPIAAPIPAPPTSAGPPRQVNASLVPATIPGWTAAVSTTRNAAYDVPADWKYTSPGLIKGFTDPDGNKVVMSGVATHGSRVCPGSNYPQPDIWSGVTGAPTPDTALAARGVAKLWTGAFVKNGKQPTVSSSPPTPVTVGDKTGSFTKTMLTIPGGSSCGSDKAVLYTVALPANRGESVVLVMLGDEGLISDEDVRRVIGTFRPAGLPEKCNSARPATGSWC